MEVAICTVGDEVLAGDTTNTNAAWLAAEITDRGSSVVRILTIPDDRELITETVIQWATAFDAVIVTGGLGGTHDDVTADAIADAFDQPLVVDDAVREDVVETVADYRGLDPERIDDDDLDLSVESWAAVPASSRPLLNPEGLCPGFVLENVYAFPGVPDEVRALFDRVADEFGGETVSQTFYTPLPEAAMVDALEDARERFDVTIGSYPDTRAHNRVKVSGTDSEAVASAANWLEGELETVDPD
ncbi:competence/damage-inducible protein A [Natrarchaeobaculum aegyptiacum]|uniref:Competence/damage-inducible protein A n=1 Tax=Natrarchaeobaculum aegyptiacum TaxID=745377 RepID=A0A2Z2HVY1_9EURY|nr:molybdopterin-binding protein [Natrarchaeobaculum aegyptiacum]ARS91370.1 competence/damage-inducible protein A [Natrarchaeobaculum aegyptiacum]